MSDEYEQLADVVDGPDGDDWSLRPEPDFRGVGAVSAPGRRPREVDRAPTRPLAAHTSGLRTLDPGDANTLACAPETV